VVAADCTDIDAPLAPGTTQVVWQLAAVELHDIMQLVTVEVTFDVCGVIGVNDCCAEAVARTAEENIVAKANTIAARRMIASNIICSPAAKATSRVRQAS